MSTTMRALLDFGRERLRLVVPADPAELGDVQVSWLHGSDLPDPTPFLEPGQVVLTDGSQFAIDDEAQEAYDAYVARLSDHGIVAIGFGSQLLHFRVPSGLIVACERRSMVLFEVTDLTPYLAFIRFVADAAADARQARVRWTAEAQRALARAALRPDGLSSVLSELERVLRARAALFDATGARLSGAAGAADGSAAEARIREAVMSVLERGVHSVGHIEVEGEHYSVQTLAGESSLSGVLVLSEPETPHVDAPEVISSVVALATLALAQHRALDVARRHLRAGVLEQLLSGDRDLAARTAEAVWGRLPAEPAVALVVRPPERGVPLLDALEREAAESSGAVFFALRGERLVLVVEAGRLDAVLAILAKHGAVAGSSPRSGSGGLRARLDEGSLALEQALMQDRPHVPFEEVLERGILGALRGDRATTVARGVLAPVLEHDARHGTELMHSLRVWLGHDCAWKVSAAALGVHRHTLRHRVETVEHLLGLDLGTLRDRLELWAALRLDQGVGQPERGPLRVGRGGPERGGRRGIPRPLTPAAEPP